jgi:hypothetical protein
MFGSLSMAIEYMPIGKQKRIGKKKFDSSISYLLFLLGVFLATNPIGSNVIKQRIETP